MLTAVTFARLFVCNLLFNCAGWVSAQTVHLVPNPSNFNVFAKFSQQAQDLPIIYNNNLIVLMSSGNKIQLAKYSGASLSLIPNPDNGFPVGYGLPNIIYNKKLYFEYKNDSGEYELADYDGKKIELIAAPKGYSLQPGLKFKIYQDNLYLLYFNNEKKFYQLSRFDGNSISVLGDSNMNVDSGSPLIIYKNKLYFYTDSHLTAFDGNSFKSMPNPIGIYDIEGSAINFNNDLFTMGHTDSGYNLIKYNGENFTIVPNIINEFLGDIAPINGFDWYPFTYHGQLCFYVSNRTNSVVNLCKYDGNQETLIPNLSFAQAGDPPEIFPIEYNNKMYLNYADSLVQYDGATLSTVTVFNDSSYYHGPAKIFGSNLYLFYYNPYSGSSNMARFDGNAISIVPNTSGFYNHQVIFNSKLFGYYYNTNNELQLGYLDTASILPVTLINFTVQMQHDNVILNWQTASTKDLSYFIVQRSSDAKNFTNLDKVEVTNNNNITKDYFYVDKNAALLQQEKFYYRLNEIDNDGHTTYSNVCSISFTKDGSLFSASPNPAKDFINITALTNVATAQIIITNIEGKILYSSVNSFSANPQLKLDLSKLLNQLLWITINCAKGTKQFKILKQ